jgi:hypothetical protein
MLVNRPLQVRDARDEVIEEAGGGSVHVALVGAHELACAESRIRGNQIGEVPGAIPASQQPLLDLVVEALVSSRSTTASARSKPQSERACRNSSLVLRSESHPRHRCAADDRSRATRRHSA